MGAFTKTLIVDSSLIDPAPPYYNSIKKAADNNDIKAYGGTIIVEQGEYVFSESDEAGNWNTTVHVPSNVSLIGTGNVVIRITNSAISAFKNANSSNTNIKISGFKIIYDGPENETLSMHLVYLTNCSKCRLKNLTITSNNKNIDKNSYAICFTSNTQNTTRGNIVEGCRIHDYGSSFYHEEEAVKSDVRIHKNIDCGYKGIFFLLLLSEKLPLKHQTQCMIYRQMVFLNLVGNI